MTAKPKLEEAFEKVRQNATELANSLNFDRAYILASEIVSTFETAESTVVHYGNYARQINASALADLKKTWEKTAPASTTTSATTITSAVPTTPATPVTPVTPPVLTSEKRVDMDDFTESSGSIGMVDDEDDMPGLLESESDDDVSESAAGAGDEDGSGDDVPWPAE